jgi:hypothetical protein
MSDQKDAYGNPFTTSDNRPPTTGGTIYRRNSDGSLTETTWQGFVPNS